MVVTFDGGGGEVRERDRGLVMTTDGGTDRG